jgi:GAF domain-containing protein
MESRSSLQALTPLVSWRFQSFAEAAEAALGAVAGSVGGTIILGQAEEDGETWRLLDVSGAPRLGLERGTLAPRGMGDRLSPEFLRARRIGGSISLPLELSDGSIVGIVAALADDDSYGPDDLVVVSLAARMLAYEWERVRTRAELREVRQRLADGRGIDPETGLVDRAGFVELLDREWRLAKRGTVRSMLVICEVGLDAEPNGSALARLALKDTAEVLSGAARITDHVGRIAESRLATVLVGCEDIAGVEGMLARLTDSLRRVTSARQCEIDLICGTMAVGDADSPEGALQHAERSIGNVAPPAAAVRGR